jgi:hypothetical protein
MSTAELKHDDTRWRWHRQTSVDKHSQQWVLESDEAKCMAIMDLPHLSKWYKDRNPGWEQEWNQSVERVQANANLMQASNIMLRALLAAQNGDTSLIQEAIEHATGKRNWLGDIVTGTDQDEE